MKVLVYSKDNVFLSLTTPAKARILLKKNKATIKNYKPFAIKINKQGGKMFVSYGDSIVNLDKVERIELKTSKVMFFMDNVTARENWDMRTQERAKEIFQELKSLISAKDFGEK